MFVRELPHDLRYRQEQSDITHKKGTGDTPEPSPTFQCVCTHIFGGDDVTYVRLSLPDTAMKNILSAGCTLLLFSPPWSGNGSGTTYPAPPSPSPRPPPTPSSTPVARHLHANEQKTQKTNSIHLESSSIHLEKCTDIHVKKQETNVYYPSVVPEAKTRTTNVPPLPKNCIRGQWRACMCIRMQRLSTGRQRVPNTINPNPRHDIEDTALASDA